MRRRSSLQLTGSLGASDKVPGKQGDSAIRECCSSDKRRRKRGQREVESVSRDVEYR